MEDSKTIKQGAIFFIGIGAFVFILGLAAAIIY